MQLDLDRGRADAMAAAVRRAQGLLETAAEDPVGPARAPVQLVGLHGLAGPVVHDVHGQLGRGRQHHVEVVASAPGSSGSGCRTVTDPGPP